MKSATLWKKKMKWDGAHMGFAQHDDVDTTLDCIKPGAQQAYWNVACESCSDRFMYGYTTVLQLSIRDHDSGS